MAAQACKGDPAMPAPYVYRFGSQRTDGAAAMKNLLGGKGANLAEMCRLGIPVPPGFTISTEACTAYTPSRAATRCWR
jgi:phosphoenolpyruvate synthase/pyruvate phosphate dikinase